jgi:hypothetical protein
MYRKLIQLDPIEESAPDIFFSSLPKRKKNLISVSAPIYLDGATFSSSTEKRSCELHQLLDAQ